MNQKGFVNIAVIIGIIIVVAIAGYFVLVQKPTDQQQVVGRDGEIALVPKYPEEYLIYQDYLRTIGDKPRVSDTGIVEATVISITKSGACPDIVDPFMPEPKGCSIEPYPKDIGVVKIDKIISYIPYSEQTAEQPIEQPSGAEPSEGKTTPGYIGKDIPGSKPLKYKPLQPGQETPTSFLLTTRPVKITYTSIPPADESMGGLESEQTVESPTGLQEPLPKTYKLIPKDGDYFVFTTRIVKYPETSQKTLPGLRIGSKFRAAIHYAGSLYVGEYELIP